MAKAIPLRECYRILGVSEGATLDEIKSAYRKRAFELHPDLNPSAGASRQFQQLNEAYVLLINAQNTKSSGAGFFNRKPPEEPSAQSARAGRQTYQDQARKEREQRERRERMERERRDREEAERRLREKQEKEEKERREAERRERLRDEIERQEAERLARKEKARQEKERLAKARRQAEEEWHRLNKQPKAEAYRRTYARSGQSASQSDAGADSSQAGQSWANSASSYGGAAGASAPPPGSADGGQNAAPDDQDVFREELLRDLLNDPFARRVYEDIYSEVQSRKNVPPPPEQLTTQVAEPVRVLKRNLGDALKGWMRGQIDEEQELFFPAASLYPGAKFRLKIRPGLSGEPRTVEVTLPQDFVPGKPVRLRGMGKKVGKWQGDLYLTFQIKS